MGDQDSRLMVREEGDYLTLRRHHQKEMGSDKSHFNVSLICEGQSHKTMSTNHNF